MDFYKDIAFYAQKIAQNAMFFLIGLEYTRNNKKQLSKRDITMKLHTPF